MSVNKSRMVQDDCPVVDVFEIYIFARLDTLIPFSDSRCKLLRGENQLLACSRVNFVSSQLVWCTYFKCYVKSSGFVFARNMRKGCGSSERVVPY